MAAPDKKTFKDAFASAGPLVRQYKPFILTEAKRYAHKYRVRRRDMIAEAVRLASIAEERFDPTRGLDFSTLLRHWLLGLNRYGKRQYRLKKGIWSTKEEPLEKWEKNNRKKEVERNRLVGWGNRRLDLLEKIGFEITDYRCGQSRGPGGNYRKWKAGVGPFGSNSAARLDEAAEEIIRRRRLTKKQRAMLDWMVGNLAGRDTRTMAQAASDAGVTKGYASKVVSSIAQNMNCS